MRSFKFQFLHKRVYGEFRKRIFVGTVLVRCCSILTMEDFLLFSGTCPEDHLSFLFVVNQRKDDLQIFHRRKEKF